MSTSSSYKSAIISLGNVTLASLSVSYLDFPEQIEPFRYCYYLLRFTFAFNI